MKKLPIIPLLLFICIVVPAFGTDLTVEYLDGFLDIREDGDWYELVIGDVVTDEDTIRLDEDSVAELTMRGSKLTLTKEGIYIVADLIKSAGATRSVGLASVIGGKIKTILEEPKQEQTAVMGVRGAKSDEDLEWMSGDTAELMKSGKEYLTNGEFAEAVGVFEEAYDFADVDEETEVLFYLSFSNALMGQLRIAVEALEFVEPDPMEDYFIDLVLLKGQLLTETFAHQEALEWLDLYSSDLGDDETATQMVLLLQGINHKGLGNDKDAKTAFEQAVGLGTASDAGRAAKELLGEL